MALININYESKTLGMPVMINAIIPQRRGSYKTLYLLHGMGGDYTTWITKSRVADYVDNTDIAVIMVSGDNKCCLLYTSPSPRDRQKSRMPSSA